MTQTTKPRPRSRHKPRAVPDNGKLQVWTLRSSGQQVAKLDAWAEQHGFTRSAAGDALVAHALQLAERDGFVTLPEVGRNLNELHAGMATIHSQLLRLEALIGAVGEISGIAPLLLAQWHSTELGVRAANETPEQAEERTWDLWTAAANVEWDARRRRVAPTDEEIALERGDEAERDEEPAGEPGHDDSGEPRDDADEDPGPDHATDGEAAHEAGDDEAGDPFGF